MIDRAIFHEFTGSFATFKRALRANIKNRLNRNDNADCPNCFMSFGQAAAQGAAARDQAGAGPQVGARRRAAVD